MNHNFVQFLNSYKNALKRKNTNFKIIFSQQNYYFSNFLLSRGFISGIHILKKGKKKIINLFLKYDLNFMASISNQSISSKITQKRPITKLKTKNEKVPNLIINVVSKQNDNNNKFNQLLARLR